MILTDVKVYSRLNVQNADGYTVYEEDDLHRPLFTRSAERDTDTGCFARNDDVLYSFDRVTPRKGRELDTMELPIPWDEFQGAVGLLSTPKLITAKFSGLNMAGAYVFVYGWIDEAEPVSVKGPDSNTRVRWHPDWWLMYSDFAWFTMQSIQHAAAWSPRRVTFGEGRILRGPASLKRPEASQPRKWVITDHFPMDQRNEDVMDQWWAVMVRTVTDAQQRTTDIVTYYWPIGGTIGTKRAPSWSDIYTGQIEEVLGVDPSSIQGFWACPFAPFTDNDVFDGPTCSVYYAGSGRSANTSTRTLDDAIQTDDTRKILFTDPSGAAMYTAPWGIPVKTVVMWFDIGTSSAMLNVYLGSTAAPISEKAGAEGRLFSWPLPSLPVTSNAWSEYNYTGQREYDIRNREIQRNQNAVNGISGAATGAIGGAMTGAIVGAAGGPIGAAAGAAIGLGASLLGTGLTYGTSGVFDRKTQDAIDKLTSNQTAALILTAGSQQAIEPPYGSWPGWNAVVMDWDTVSKAELETEQDELGYLTDTYSADCSAVIAAGGGLRIDNLSVHGDMSNKGKDYIRAMFARGVHLDLIEG